MNPEDNNPLNTAGASDISGSLDSNAMSLGGMPSATSPDLSIPSSDNLASPADSLASVENNLNTMGMGNDFGANSTGSMYSADQTAGADMATPQFTAPEAPLTPAAPVPGSIGSAMSAPASAALPVADDTATPAVGNAMGSAAPTSAASASTSASAAPSADLMTSVTEMGSLPPTNSAQSGLGVVTDVNQAGHYNPFAQPAMTDSNANTAGQGAGMNATAGVGSASTPSAADQLAAFQPITAAQAQSPAAVPAPKTKGHGSKLNLILGVALVITAIVAIVFVVLYINASNNVKKISVAPITDGNVVQTPVKEITCELNREDGGNEVLTLNYLGDNLSQISITQNSSYESPEAAAAERDILEAQRAANLNISGLMEEPYDVSFVADGNMVTATITATADKLRPEDADLLMLTTVDGALDTSEATVRSNYEARGFVCSE